MPISIKTHFFKGGEGNIEHFTFLFFASYKQNGSINSDFSLISLIIPTSNVLVTI